jgi:glycosyltransferase involved in cell wall biosynthesis
MLSVVSWQPTLTEHQVHLLRALAAQEGVRLRVVVGRSEFPQIRELGWRTPVYDDLDVTIIGPQGILSRGARIVRKESGSIHVFSAGLWTDRRFFVLLLLAVAWRRRVALVTEPYTDVPESHYGSSPGLSDYIKTWLRPAAYGSAGAVLGRSVAPVFAISPKAEAQMRRAGFRSSSVYPFGYFVPADEGDAGTNAGPSVPAASLRVAFVGNLIHRKGVDTAIDAVEKARRTGAHVSLDVYGPGDVTKLLSGAGPAVRHRGAIPFGMTQRVLRSYDVLVVPSRFDGWAVVVNEALLQGTPVIASRSAGASVLVESSGAGAVFDAGDSAALAALLVEVSRDAAALGRWRAAARAYSRAIAPEAAAKFMRQCLLFQGQTDERPSAPWLTE